MSTTTSPRSTGFPPLTTVFTAPASCESRLPTLPPPWLRNDPIYSDRIDLYMEYSPNLGYAERECYPDFWNQPPYLPETGVLADRPFLSTGYSPGICPAGYTTNWQTVYDTRTWAACCAPPLSGWKEGGLATWCAFAPTEPVVALAWDASVRDYSMLSRISPSVRTTMTPTTKTRIYVLGIHIAVIWESRDLPLFEAATRSASLTASASASSAPPGTESEGQSSAPGTGTIAAIALGSLIAVVLLLGGGLLWRQRNRKKAILTSAETGLHASGGKAELDGKTARAGVELQDELAAAAPPPVVELEAGRYPRELP